MPEDCEIKGAVHETRLDEIIRRLDKIESNQEKNTNSINDLKLKVDNGGVAVKVFFAFGALVTFILSIIKLATIFKEMQ